MGGTFVEMAEAHALFLPVGFGGRKLPARVVRKLTKELRTYGLVEKPGWYPKLLP